MCTPWKTPDHDAFVLAGSADEERYQEALRIVGNTLLAKAAVKNAEAAFTVWMHNVKKSYPYHSKVCNATQPDPVKRSCPRNTCQLWMLACHAL